MVNNTFNILRMFAAIYGPLDAPKMLVCNKLSVPFTLWHIICYNVTDVFLMFRVLSNLSQLSSCL